MSEEGGRWGAYDSVGKILRIGVILSLVVLIVGLILAVVGRGAAESPPSLNRLSTGLLNGEASAFVSLGILLLILTPVSRVLFTLFYFGKNRDATFTVLALVVLVNLMIGFFLGVA